MAPSTFRAIWRIRNCVCLQKASWTWSRQFCDRLRRPPTEWDKPCSDHKGLHIPVSQQFLSTLINFDPSHQLLFHVCLTSVSWMPCLSACSSKKSNIYLMASGRALPRCTVLNKVSNKSSTNFCSVPWWEQRRECEGIWPQIISRGSCRTVLG